MNYVLRVLLFIAGLLLAVVLITGLCVMGFKVAEASGNAYVIASEGMQVRAQNILMPNAASTGDMAKYFTVICTADDSELTENAYAGDRITAFDYRASVESVWAQPWKNRATVTLTESVPTINGVHPTGDTDDSGAAVGTACAPWEKRRYKLTLLRQDEQWLIDRMEILEVLEPDPTPTPEPPMSDVRTLPAPTPTPTPEATAAK